MFPNPRVPDGISGPRRLYRLPRSTQLSWSRPRGRFAVFLVGNRLYCSESTNWVPYRDSSSFAYLGKTEPERVQFMHTLVNAKIVSIEFKPFLTGTPVKVSFDTRSLRDELSKHPECSEQ